MKHKPIDQQVIVVVGAASGIGRETTLEFAKRKAKLLVSDNDEQGLRSLVQEVGDAGGQIVGVPADVAHFDQVQAVADEAITEYGRIDTWVHLAAVALYALFQDTTPEEFQRVVNVNLMGQVHGAMAALPHLKQQGAGALIHVSSVEAKRALPYHSAYSAAKHGVDGFLEALRVELQHEKLPITVAQILPASINTPLFDKSRTKMGVKPKGVPPFYRPSLVARSILYAAEHPVRDLTVGGAGKVMLTTQRLSPRVMDGMMRVVGFRAQKTSDPKPAEAPNNLFEPVGQYNTVQGGFRKLTLPHSLPSWLDRHPRVKRTIMSGAILGGIALIQNRGAKDEPNGRTGTKEKQRSVH